MANLRVGHDPVAGWRWHWVSFTALLFLSSLMCWCGSAVAKTTLDFTQPVYNASIPENSVGKTYVTSTEKMGIFISDPSLVVRYKIVAGDQGKLFKSESRNVGDFCFLMIRTRTEEQAVLNREYQDHYELDVRATITSLHRRSVKLKADTTVNIHILDTNDLNPLFLSSEYDVVVKEDTPLHKSVFQLTASDADSGINSEIYFRLREPTLQFAVHPTRGTLTLTRPLNFQKQPTYQLTVEAQDRGPKFRAGDLRVSTATVRINVTPVNLFEPEITVRNFPTILEKSDTDIYAIVRVTDKDQGIHGEIDSLQIISGDPGNHFQISEKRKSNEFNLELKRGTDQELTSGTYTLTLQATDRGIPPKSSTQAMQVKIHEAENKPPVFSQSDYDVEVEEVAPPHSPLVQVKALPSRKFSNILYTIESGNDFNMFSVNSNTGLITTLKPLDRETKAYYSLTVSAVDRSLRGPKKKGNTIVNVKVLDNNDNNPEFNSTSVTVIFDENKPAGSLVYSVHAFDQDEGDNGYVTYSLANLVPVPFDIDHFSGDIKTSDVLDYETMRREYNLKVRASDWGSPYRRQSEMTVRVKIHDINDHRPLFEKIDCVGYVSDLAGQDTEILTLSAIDFDAGSIVTYRMVPGNEDSCFNLDPVTGVLKVKCNLSQQNIREKILNVSATDGKHFADVMSIHLKIVSSGGNKHLTDHAAVVECRDVGVTERLKEQIRLGKANNKIGDISEPSPVHYGENRHIPEFIPLMPTEVWVNESAPVGTEIAVLRARDRDHGYSGRVVHVISSGDEDSCFKLDLYSGRLLVLNSLDRERTSKYVLNVTAFDLGRPQKSVSLSVTVHVEDVNDNVPTFEKVSYNFVIPEDVQNGTSIVRLRANDPDLGVNAQLSYSLDRDYDEFYVDPSLGLLTVHNQLDRERQEEYNLPVRVIDSSPDHPLSSTCTVNIKVLDVNDNPPQFVLSQFWVKIREDVPPGSVVMIMTARDPDEDQGSLVQYSLLSGGGNTFHIDPLMGVIRLVEPLDFEEKQLYNVTVEAKDRGDPSLSSIAYLLVEVEDVNENFYPPKFPDMVASGVVKENQPSGTFVIKVEAKDQDRPGVDSIITYSIRDGDGMGVFTIDDQGNIRTKAILDRETMPRYWITVYAQDRGAVPLTARLDVHIEVLDENDNTPLTLEPAYYPTVVENTEAGSSVVKLDAFDLDSKLNQRLQYQISAGDPQGFFSINSSSGLITTTNLGLDREAQAEHVLEIVVADNGEPSLSSTTRVLVTVLDVNDHSPSFSLPLYRCYMYELSKPGPTLCQVFALDFDAGVNGDITYTIEGPLNNMFRVHPKTGAIYSQGPLHAGYLAEITVKAEDGGQPALSSTSRVVLEVLPHPVSSRRPPIIKDMDSHIFVTESDIVGQLVTLVRAEDPDGDHLWYSITGGNVGDVFTIQSDQGKLHKASAQGAVLLARPLDWDTRKFYNLTITVTDGIHNVQKMLQIKVHAVNKYQPQFSEPTYTVDVVEDIEVGTEVLQLEARDRYPDNRLLYALHSSASPRSLKKFHLHSTKGILSVAEPLDHESVQKHILTVMVKGSGTPSKRSFARVEIRVQDHNDHAPEFLASIFEGQVYETAAIGTSVVQVLATDRDKGRNAQISFSILSGNVGATFAIEPTLGIIRLAKELDRRVMSEYFLIVRSTDHGQPPLNSSVTVHILVTVADNAPPRFLKSEYSVDILENSREGLFVISVSATSRSSVHYEIMSNNHDDSFVINPTSGVIHTSKSLDYEEVNFYNLTVSAINMLGAVATSVVLVHILDRNDNAPEFLQPEAFGIISEAAEVGSIVFDSYNRPLVIAASDKDSELNAVLTYQILDKLARLYFRIDSSTGAISTAYPLDHEKASNFTFVVQVIDAGKPRLAAEVPALVHILVTDVNDCPPQFEKSLYVATVMLPTYKDVIIAKVKANDPDTVASTVLKYNIVSGNHGEKFIIDESLGIIYINNPEDLREEYQLVVSATDGEFETSTKVAIRVKEPRVSGLKFSQEKYTAVIVENSPEIHTVAVITVLGAGLNEHLVFNILNPSEMFEIGKTSGVIRTTGKSFDREIRGLYVLVVEVKSELLPETKVAHVLVEVTILDVNDNAPIFVNLPYYSVVPVEAPLGYVVRKVHAVDLDLGVNSYIRYELIEGDNITFHIGKESGEITLQQPVSAYTLEYQLTVAAIDGGDPVLQSTVAVPIRLINRDMPVFPKQFYNVSIPETLQAQSPVLTVLADSPEGRQLIYSIVNGNNQEDFGVDFNTDPSHSSGPCVIHVVEDLDYEAVKLYHLTLSATDSVSGAFANVLITINIEDMNDNAPIFDQPSYNATISETAPFGTSILQVHATDNDSGLNEKIQYYILGNASSYFHVEPSEGIVFIKQSLDYETLNVHQFVVMAIDSGTSPLSSTAMVTVKVLDINDNPPKFDHPSYSCAISEHAQRGQFVTRVFASDPDVTDLPKLSYAIVGGNEQQIFSIDSSSGIISLSSVHQFSNQSVYSFNVSVTDGVYSSYTRVKVDIVGANLHSPVFTRTVYEVAVQENLLPGAFVTKVIAMDLDKAEFGKVTYSIQSQEYEKAFEINKDSGIIYTRISMDREKRHLYEIPVVGSDSGGRLGYATVRVTITDVNDNTPQFSVSEYKATVHENTTIGTTVLQVHAIDNDEGQSATLEYSIYVSNTSAITDIFDISRDLGEIYIKKRALKLVNQAYQFFVRVRDNGIPPKETEVPVNILTVGSNEVIPKFEQHNYEFFLSEKSPIGTVISTLNVSSVEPITYCFVPPPYDSEARMYSSIFSISSSGKILLNSVLDREQVTSYHLVVKAETNISPPLVVYANIIINVMDENDNVPLFESDKYLVTVAENIEKDATILKVVANDADVGRNADVAYSFGPDAGNIANVFHLDSKTGWLTTMIELDHEMISSYNFSIVARDKGNPSLSSSTLVVILVQDYNDNPPLFQRNHYDTAINEDALPGTVIVTLEIKDADLIPSPVEYYITSGNPQNQFQIRQTGEIYVNKPLDREQIASYLLDITATDSIFVSWTQVAIDVLDANDNQPWCLKARYSEVISESMTPQTYLLTVEAMDADDHRNAQLRYYLSGQGAEDFIMDPSTGIIKTFNKMDREHQAYYSLTAHVQDRGHSDWECTSTVSIAISDVNDNAPQFIQTSYILNVPEDIEVGTVITKVHATDKDLGINRKISYSFLESSNGQFIVDERTGIVRLNKRLDREIEASYNLTLQATDHGVPQLYSTTHLTVIILDVNDNPPEFSHKFYYATVPEDASAGTEVVKVLATSRDLGINAEISYFISGGNEQEAFRIHPKSGIISVARNLDYETIRDYFITIQAVDGGTPPLSSQAVLNISVSDTNDNSPIFSQPSYLAIIREDSQVGDKVIQVLATDADSPVNGHLSFQFTKGNSNEHFKIDKQTGYITVHHPLDREKIPTFILEIRCDDSGLPSLSASTTVQIEVADVNDNPPLFSQTNYTAILQEGKPVGHTIFKFSVTDADAPPNTSPFTFSFLSGNENNAFRLVQQDASLRTAVKFDHKQCSNYHIQIAVTDSGSPSLSSSVWITVMIIEESQYAPVISSLDITINSYLDSFPGGPVGVIHASDQDPYDKLTYDLSTSNDLFTIDKEDGTLIALPGLDIGSYNINVSVSDGKFTTFSSVTIEILIVTEDALKNSINVRLDGVTPEDFLLTYRKGFLRGIRNIMNVRTKDIDIIGLQPAILHGDKEKRSAQGLDILFAVRKSPQMYYSRKVLYLKLKEKQTVFESSVGLKVVKILKDRCTSDHCDHGECIDKVIINETSIATVTAETFSHVFPVHSRKLECLCEAGYGGLTCDLIINECARKPCPPQQLCKPDSSALGYKCQCPTGKVGLLCDREKVKFCHSNICFEENNPISFRGNSYARYTFNGPNDRHLSVSLNLRTIQITGNLMYAAGIRDYSILEVVNGLVQYRFDCGSGEGLVRIEQQRVTDGMWHEVRIERRGNSAELIVDKQFQSSGSAPGVHDILNLDGNDIYFGAEVRPHPNALGYDDVRMAFIGCMDDIKIDSVTLPIHTSGSNGVVTLRRLVNVDFQCEVLHDPGVCGSQPCANGGTCKSEDNMFTCTCIPRFRGVRCDLDTNPCASSPCVNGGTCHNLYNDFHCDCPIGISGKRCDYGRYCNPNPCHNGGACKEGSFGPSCKCHGFSGDLCQYDINECQPNNPCANGATCFNVHGSFHCQCPPNVTGPLCTETVFTNSITSTTWNTTTEEIVGIIVVIFFILLLSSALVGWWHFRHKRRQHHHHHPPVQLSDEIMLKNIILEKDNVKRISKISNLEVSTTTTPPLPPRPESYTPSTQEALNAFNKFDTVRSYGSAADELENVTRFSTEFLQNLNKPIGVRSTLTPPPPSNSDTDSLLKAGWDSDSKEKIYEEKIQNGYDWDVSDWAHKPVSDITKVSQSEVNESSSGQSSTDSNSVISQIELLPAQDSAAQSAHSLNHTISPSKLHANVKNGDLHEKGAEDVSGMNSLDFADSSHPSSPLQYQFHPNEYLPSQCLTGPCPPTWNSYRKNNSELPEDDIKVYGFPSQGGRGFRLALESGECGDVNRNSVLDTLSSVGECPSCSDLSGAVCDLEDSETNCSDTESRQQEDLIPTFV